MRGSMLIDGTMFYSALASLICLCGAGWCQLPPHTDFGLSNYCRYSLLSPDDFLLPRPECCSFEYWCNEFIEPRQTKYGIINDSFFWSIRTCTCDADFFLCLTKDQDIETILKIRRGFDNEKCFASFMTYTHNGAEYDFFHTYHSLSKILSLMKASSQLHEQPLIAAIDELLEL